MKPIRVVLAFAACMSLAAHAANGLVEINHARALAGGVTAGDSVGYPVTISASGSYILTSNLAPTVTAGISITASNVTIDLNGFTISGTGNGIISSGSNVVVKNGTVFGMNQTGITLGTNSRVENVRAIGNTSDGITVGDGSVVVNSIATGNGGKGIIGTSKSVLKDNVATGNTGDATPTANHTFLLFPYVSSAPGTETTITISNTSKDVTNLGTALFGGICAVTFVKGTDASTIIGNTLTIPGGQQASWPMSTGGSGVPAVAGFTGYLIAECNFPFAHGVAILTGTGTSTTLPAYVVRPQRLGNYPESLGN